MLLFREVLVIARRIDAGIYTVHLQLSMRSLRLQDSVPDLPPLRFGIEVEDKTGTCVVIYLRSVEERRSWIAAIRSVLKSAQFEDLLSLVSFKNTSNNNLSASSSGNLGNP